MHQRLLMIAFLGLLPWALVCSCSGLGTGGSRPKANSAVLSQNAETSQVNIAMSNQNSTENPYHTSYKPWDLWIASEVAKNSGKVYLWNSSVDSIYRDLRAEDPTVRIYSFLLDANNNQIPMIVDMAQQEEYQSRYRDEEYLAQTRYVVIGHPPADVDAAYKQAILRQRATTMPNFPQWLLSNPPLVASMLPDGRIIVRGELGSGKGITTRGKGSCCGDKPADASSESDTVQNSFGGYILFSADGKELSRVEDSNWWRMLYGLDKPLPAGYIDYSDPWAIRFRSDHDAFTDQARGAILSTWLWSGERINEQQVPPLEQREFQYLKSWDAAALNTYGGLKSNS